jgi:hypothetical protein
MGKKNRPKRKSNPGRRYYHDLDSGWEPVRKPETTVESVQTQVNKIIKNSPEARPVITEFMMGKFYMLPDVAARFSEYARAAQPNEIGGFCRVQKSGKNFIVTDLKVFPQSASATFFEMDGRARNRWIMDMRKQGRKDELPEWNCMIHSHPEGCPPFLSGTDLEQIVELGHRRHFWSIIQTASKSNIMSLDWRVHYYHGGNSGETPPVLVKDIPVDLLHPDWKQIHDEVNNELRVNSSDFIGSKEGRGDFRRPVGFTTFGVPYNEDRAKLLAASESLASISDLEPGDVPSVENHPAFSDYELAELRAAGVNVSEVEAAIEAEFMGTISEGSVVTVTDDVIGSDAFAADPDTVRDMVDSEFVVEDVTTDGLVILNDGIVLHPDVLEVVQE